MEMKIKIQYFFILILFSGFLWTGCDRVDDGLVITNVQDIPVNQDTVFVIDSIIVAQKQVLLEDFTGHLCVNCPEAAVTAHEWAEDYDHKLVIYSIHAGPLADTNETGNYTYNFTNPTGDEIFNYFNQPYNPMGTVNRVEVGGTYVLLFDQWSSAIASEMAKPNVIDMKLVNKYFPNQNSVQINVSATVRSALESNYKIVVMIVEDLIIRPQKNNKEEIGPVPDWLDYPHRNILRDAVTATFGQNVSADGTVDEGETYYNMFYYKLDQSWVSDTADYTIISYIYDTENLNIMQVAELGIKTEE